MTGNPGYPQRDAVVEFGGIEVVYVDGISGRPIAEQAPAAFDALEARLATLKRKKFYGAVIDGTYRACVGVDPDTSALELPRWVIPFGRYVLRKIADWERHRSEIGPAAAELRRRSDCDASRPVIEFYRSRAELRILCPLL